MLYQETVYAVVSKLGSFSYKSLFHQQKWVVVWCSKQSFRSQPPTKHQAPRHFFEAASEVCTLSSHVWGPSEPQQRWRSSRFAGRLRLIFSFIYQEPSVPCKKIWIKSTYPFSARQYNSILIILVTWHLVMIHVTCKGLDLEVSVSSFWSCCSPVGMSQSGYAMASPAPREPYKWGPKRHQERGGMWSNQQIEETLGIQSIWNHMKSPKNQCFGYIWLVENLCARFHTVFISILLSNRGNPWIAWRQTPMTFRLVLVLLAADVAESSFGNKSFGLGQQQWSPIENSDLTWFIYTMGNRFTNVTCLVLYVCCFSEP